MKPTMLKSHDRLISKLALIGVFGALLTGCGNQDTAEPKSYDVYEPRITLNNPGADAIVLTDSGSELIPHEDICYEYNDDCNDVTRNSSNMIHYTALENDQKVFKSLEGTITGYSEEHKFGTVYTDPGARARDVYDGHVDVVISGSTGIELGSYTIAYSATDSSNNQATLNRVVNVVDMDPPTISLNGDSAMILAFFSDFADPGATALDNVDGEMNANDATITFQQKNTDANSEEPYQDVEVLSTDFPAEYRVNYQFVDSAGNSSIVRRTVIVSPAEGETITILKDGVLGTDWDSGIQAFDQDLNWSACTVPAGCPNIDWGFVEDNERGSVLEITHADTSAGAGIFISSSDSIDIRDAEDDGFIKFDLKVTEGDRSIVFKADCGYPCGGGDQYVEVLEENKWQTVIVPVKSLIPNGPSGNTLDLETLKAGLVIQAQDAKATTFRIDNAYYDCRAATCAGISIPFVPVDWEATHEDPNDPEAFVAPTAYDGYTLAWSDEFDGDTVNTDNWGFDIGNGNNGWGNGELEYYREENASVKDGLLIIEAQKHVPPIDLPQKTGNRYTSSKLTSIDKVEFKYGRVDIRAVVAKGQGMWSAGWMLGANWSEIGWPYSGEIDIFDTIAGTKYGSPQEGMIVNNMYWNSTGPDPSEPLRAQGINDSGNAEYRINASNVGETFSNRFHVFSLIWDEDNIIFEVDGVNTDNDVALVGALAETYRNPFFLILNVAVGGAWPGPPDETTSFPDGMLVDYVRVYQTDSDGDGIADFELDGETPLDLN